MKFRGGADCPPPAVRTFHRKHVGKTLRLHERDLLLTMRTGNSGVRGLHKKNPFSCSLLVKYIMQIGSGTYNVGTCFQSVSGYKMLSLSRRRGPAPPKLLAGAARA